MPPLLTKEDILRADDRQRVRVFVPEWGGDVLIARLDGLEVIAFHIEMETRPRTDIVPVLLTYALVDENGKRLFTLDDFDALASKAGGALGRLFKLATEHNRLGDREVARAQGESEPGPTSATA